MRRRTAGTPSRRRTRACVAALVCLLVGVAGAAAPATAAPKWMRGAEGEVEPRNLVDPPEISLEEATRVVRRQTGGRVLSASPARRGGQRGYEVRVLLDGKRVKNLFVDGEGRVRNGN